MQTCTITLKQLVISLPHTYLEQKTLMAKIIRKKKNKNSVVFIVFHSYELRPSLLYPERPLSIQR